MLILAIVITVTLLDQVIKVMVSRHVALSETIQIIPGFFNLAYARNTGAAWGTFHDFNGLLAIFSFVILAILLLFRRSILNNTTGNRLALAMMIAGIIGNLMDRLRLGFVVDFLDFYWRTWHFPTFNVADSSICIGVAIYVLSSYLERNQVGGDHAAANGLEGKMGPAGNPARTASEEKEKK